MNTAKQEMIRAGKSLAPVIMLFCVAILGTLIFNSTKKEAVAPAQPQTAAETTLEKESEKDLEQENQKLNERVRFEAANRLLTLSALFARTGATENAVKYFIEAYNFVGGGIFKALDEPELKIIRDDPRILKLIPPPDNPQEQNTKTDKNE